MNQIESNKKLVEKFLRLSSQGDTPGAMELLSADVQFTTMGATHFSGTRDFAQLEQLMRGLADAIPGGIDIEILAYTAEQDRVSCEARGKSVTASGTAYNNEYHFLFYIRDGKICRAKEYLDTQLLASAFAPEAG